LLVKGAYITPAFKKIITPIKTKDEKPRLLNLGNPIS
jgi:hypothetical protein